MREQPSPPQIFNAKIRDIKRSRAARRAGTSFLLRRCAEDAAERLIDVNRVFDRAVIIGLPDFRDALLDYLPTGKHPKSILDYRDFPADLEPQSTDLILSGLVLQSLNDVPEVMRSARQALVPDGLFLSAILGGESLLGLRRACFAADLEKLGGAAARVAPMIDMQQAAGLLGAAGLALPVVDKDSFRVNYAKLQTLIEDLRDIGETSALSARPDRFPGRDYLNIAAANYTRDNSKFPARFEIIWMTGWAPDKNQQQPLKPGSAKTRLSDALKQIRDN